MGRKHCGKRRNYSLRAISFFPPVFLKDLYCRHIKNRSCFRKGQKVFFHLILTLPKQALVFTCLQYKSFENTAGKGEIARNQQFLLFPLCFLPIWMDFLPFSSNLKFSSANSFGLEESKICHCGKG